MLQLFYYYNISHIKLILPDTFRVAAAALHTVIGSTSSSQTTAFLGVTPFCTGN